MTVVWRSNKMSRLVSHLTLLTDYRNFYVTPLFLSRPHCQESRATMSYYFLFKAKLGVVRQVNTETDCGYPKPALQ